MLLEYFIIINNNMKGGDIIESGSYGCVFYPSLQCKTRPNTNEITKLMAKKHGMLEYILNVKIRELVKTIPNHSKYFIFSNSKCELTNINNSDLTNYSKCGVFKELELKQEDILKQKEKFILLNQKFGGIELSQLIQTNILSKKMHNIINMCISLLLNAIIPMNKLKVYHFDLKSNNVLYNKNLSIIDWGLSMINPSITDLKNTHIFESFIFNIPFGSVLFGNKFDKYSQFAYGIVDEKELDNYFMNYEKNRHFKYLEIIFSMFQFNEDVMHIVKQYILNILKKYTIQEYYEIFLFNADIWGFLTFLVTTMESIKSYSMLDKYYKKNMSILKELIYYLYTSIEKINVQYIVKKLKKLSIMFGGKVISTKKNNILKSKSNTLRVMYQ